MERLRSASLTAILTMAATGLIAGYQGPGPSAPAQEGWSTRTTLCGDGYAISTATRGNITGIVSAPEGSTMELGGSSAPGVGEASVSVTTPDTKNIEKEDWSIVAANRAAGRNVITDAMRMGLTYEEAVQFNGGTLQPGQLLPARAEALRALGTEGDCSGNNEDLTRNAAGG